MAFMQRYGIAAGLLASFLVQTGAMAAVAAAPSPATAVRLGEGNIGELWSAGNSELERADDFQTEPVLRWKLEAGQSAILAVKPGHPIFERLRYYDRLEFEFRIVGGEIDSLDLSALGHVSGPRQYKIHQWGLGIRTTEAGVWHRRQVDLSRPNWFPWDDPDGNDPCFRFGALALSPGTAIEFRRVVLSSSPVVVKPFFEPPVTWPIRSEGEDGSVIYKVEVPVLNTSSRPTTINAHLASKHERFSVQIEPSSRAVKNGGMAVFTATARMTSKEIAGTPELYTEPLILEFSTENRPNVATTFEMPIVRPLSPGLKRQFVVSGNDLKFLRAKLQAGDAAFRQAIKADEAIQEADAFLQIGLMQIPGGYAHPANRWPIVPDSKPPRRYELGTVMPEIVNPLTGEKEAGTPAAGAVWKEYLGYTRQATEKLGMAYLLTGDERYASKAVELMKLYAQQYAGLKWTVQSEPFWGAGPATLSASRTAQSSSYGSNRVFRWHMRMLGLISESPSLTPEARESIYRGFVIPYAAELAKFPGGISNMTDMTNHNLLAMGIVFDDAHLVRWALNTDAGLISRLRDIDDEGFSSEGRPLNYHTAAMDEYLPAMAYLANSGLNVAYPKERLLEAVRMPYRRATLWGAVPNTGDCGRGMTVSNSPLADYLVELFPEENWLLDIGRDRTLAAKVRRAATGRQPQPQGYTQYLESKPRLFRGAGLAILRAGETPETQIMATLDFGRNPMHGHLDRNQITLSAFGKIFSHGPGSVYNLGSGGITKSDDPRLRSFCGAGSLGQNVVLVDCQNQRPAAGKLLAWRDDPADQYARARVEGTAPGVSHTRTLRLKGGLVIVIDRLDSAEEHCYDFVYHNFGEQKPGAGWSAKPVESSLANTANYENIQELAKLNGAGALHLTWDLTSEVRPSKKAQAPEAAAPPVHLALWQCPIPNSEIYTGLTGLNNPNTGRVPDAAPSLFVRTRGTAARFVTVLEPYKEKAMVTGVALENGTLVIYRGNLRERISLEVAN